VGLRADGCRPGIVAHACHFAEEFSGPEFGDGTVVRQIDGGVDRNERTIALLAATVFFARREQALQAAEEASAAAFGLDVRYRAGKKDLCCAFHDVKSS